MESEKSIKDVNQEQEQKREPEPPIEVVIPEIVPTKEVVLESGAVGPPAEDLEPEEDLEYEGGY